MHLDARSIENGLYSREFVLRITDEKSITPILSNGFTSSSLTSDFPSNKIWKIVYHPLRGNRSWLKHPSELDRIIDHITGGWGGYNSNVSKWISTSIDLEYIIWEIARRLTNLYIDEVNLTVIRRNGKFSKNYKGNKDLKIDPTPLLNNYSYSKRINVEDKEKCQKALNFSNAFGEILYYGRIFKKDIVETTFWTKYSTGFRLPDHYYKSPKHWKADDTWLDRLIWNPSDTSIGFLEVKRKIQFRKDELQRTRR